ncbi:hypothetical protein P607_02710, partial [Comamonas thiooxydans]
MTTRQLFFERTTQERKLHSRSQAIEPIIGLLKADHQICRCHLKGQHRDRLHALLCVGGYNLRRLLRVITNKGGDDLLAPSHGQIGLPVEAVHPFAYFGECDRS